MSATAADLGYAMGLLVGEGSFAGGGWNPVIQMSLQVDDPQPLLFLRRVFGGRIYGPYSYKSSDRYTRKAMWHWRLRGPELRAAVPLIFSRLPPSRKREQFVQWVSDNCLVYGGPSLAEGRADEMFHVEHSIHTARGVLPASSGYGSLLPVDGPSAALRRPESHRRIRLRGLRSGASPEARRALTPPKLVGGASTETVSVPADGGTA